ncbi:hypothetical protein ABIC50_004843 [Burkholderia sp. 567]
MARDLNGGGRHAYCIGGGYTLVTMYIGDEQLIARFFERI